jgi:hypothetical protein
MNDGLAKAFAENRMPPKFIVYKSQPLPSNIYEKFDPICFECSYIEASMIFKQSKYKELIGGLPPFYIILSPTVYDEWYTIYKTL